MSVSVSFALPLYLLNPTGDSDTPGLVDPSSASNFITPGVEATDEGADDAAVEVVEYALGFLTFGS